jgi:hypothetical protein
MDTKITEIEILLDKLNLLFESVKNDGAIDKVELELLKKYVQQLQNKLNEADSNPVAPKVIIPEIKAPEIKTVIETPVVEVKQPEMKQPEVKVVQEVIKETPPVVEKIETPPVVKIEMPPVVEKVAPVIEKKEVPPVEEKPVVKAPVSGNDKKPLAIMDDDDEEDDYNAGLNNKLSKEKKTLADKITSSIGKDLKSIIDLNEKLFFINKMFKGDKDAYEACIKSLNGLTDFASAQRYIQSELIPKYQWKEEEAIERLTEVVQRKFE